MRKASLLIALLAVLQMVAGTRLAQAQDRANDRRTVEEALDRAGQELERELESLLEELGVSAEEMAQSLERWAEQNGEELEAWAQKHSKEWEAFGEKFGRKIERIARDQEGVWKDWAKNYERDLTRIASQLESGDLEIDGDEVGVLIERNLRQLSNMPLGDLVDQVVKDGLGGLSDAPWESLDELGGLANSAVQDSLAELNESINSDGRELEALRQSGHNMIQTLDQLRREVEENLSTETDRSWRSQDRRVRDVRDPATVKALQRFLQDRKNLSAAQREQIQQLIDNVRDADSVGRSERVQVDVPNRDQILEKIQREKQRHLDAMDAFNQDLRRSSEESRRFDREQRERERRNRQPKGVDGKELNAPPKSTAKQFGEYSLKLNKGRDARANQSSKKPATQKQGKKTKPESDNSTREFDDLDQLRRQLERLQKEVERLKKEGS